MSDRKIAHTINSSTIDYYEADVVSTQDYYPFGMIMPGRATKNRNDYRYGFNGKEDDNEVKGTGNQQDYGMRIYDPRIGRFLSADPLSEKFAKLSPYQFASDRPILMIDLDGLEGSLGINGSSLVTQPAYSLIEFDSDGDYKPEYGKGWAAGALFTFGSGTVVLTAGRALPILKQVAFRLTTDTRAIALYTTSSAALAKYGPDAVNFAYGMFTGDALEPLPTNTGSQASDIGVTFRSIFKSPISPINWLKAAGAESSIFIKGSKGGKVAVIGQGMDKVAQVAKGLKNAEVFKPTKEALEAWDDLLKSYDGKRIPEEVVKGTQIYKENVKWIENVKSSGYDILDTGGGKTSTFYNMEKKAVYGAGAK